MSAFTEPLAQARRALRPGITPAEALDALAALAQVERLATDMETALRDAEVGFSDISVMIEAENEGFLERAYHRACDEWERARAALSAREEGMDKN